MTHLVRCTRQISFWRSNRRRLSPRPVGMDLSAAHTSLASLSAGLEQLAGRWLGGLAPATARGYSADVRAWLT